MELRDTFHAYSDDNWTWLEEAEFVQLDLRTRRALLHGRAATGRVRGHRGVTSAIWKRAGRILPAAGRNRCGHQTIRESTRCDSTR